MKRVVAFIAFVALFATGAQAQIVGATNQRGGSNSDKPSYRQTGSYLKFEVGTPFSIAYDYQISPYFAVGGGLGYHFPEIYSPFVFAENNILSFAECTVSTPGNRWGLFANLRMGPGCCISDGTSFFFYYGLSVGGSFRNFRLGVGIQNGMFDEQFSWQGNVSPLYTYIEHGLMLYFSYSLPIGTR